jgi:uncharacterized protein (DUF2384 family)
MATKAYTVRKQWRIKLHAKRCADQNQSDVRYARDAKVLNRAMDIYKIDGRRATW